MNVFRDRLERAATVVLLGLTVLCASTTLAFEPTPIDVHEPLGATGPTLATLSPRTLAVQLRVDRGGMQIAGYTIKDRPHVRTLGPLPPSRSTLDGASVQIEVRLIGPAGAEHVERLDVPGLCLLHGADAEPHIEGDTIRLHRETFLVELPELVGFDRVEAAYFERDSAGLARRSLGVLELDRARFTAAGGPFVYDNLRFADPADDRTPDPEPTASTVQWPEAFGDPDIYRVYGVEAEGPARINVVIVPDGYTYSQKALMETHAASMVNHFRNKTPYAQHDPFLNYILVYAYSPQSGTDECDCGTTVTTAMGTRFPAQNLQCGNTDNRCLYYGTLCDTGGDANIGSAELRSPFKDVTVVMVNTSRYGGCGGSRAVYSAGNGSALEVAVHELGHTLGGLADEYSYTTSCGFGAGEINTSSDPIDGAWPEWIADLGVPRQGAQYYQQCLYRPVNDCEMRNLNQPFCAVCNQHWSLVTFGHGRVAPTAPIQTMSPATPLAAYVGVAVQFSVGTRLSSGAGVTNSMSWTAKAPASLPHVVATGTTTLLHTFTQTGQHTITAEVVADTNFVKPAKYGANRDTALWTVNVQALSAPGEVSSPGVAQPLLFLSPQSLDWSDLPLAFTYNLYRGDLAGLTVGNYGSCLASGLGQSDAQDLLSPPPDSCWFYLVTGENPAGEGPLGTNSAGAPRNNGDPCTE